MEVADSTPVGLRRGTLKVFVGMAAGVGKTYAMLDEGQRRRAAGEDVVIGWLETHGRAETAARAEALEAVAPLELDYRGIRLREMDVDALIRRRPDLALIDELAHTNAAGARHEKRYEDVNAVLDGGIPVLSTLNVQHLESLSDQVFELTGVRVRETIPDQVLLEADELVLVDLTPEALRERLRAGKVYGPDQVDRALLNFFTTHNLSTLRELALRELAGAVDERLHREPAPLPAGQIDTGLPPLAERVMAVALPVRGAQRLVRRAWRAARRLGAELDVVCPDGRLDVEGERQRELIRELTTTLGGHFLSLAGDDLAGGLARLAREREITRLIMSAPRRRGLVSRLRGDLLIQLLDALEGVDIFLIAEGRKTEREDS